MKRYATQFKSYNSDKFEDIAYWPTKRAARGHVLMTLGSNPRIRAGRVFDQIEQKVIGEVHYREGEPPDA